MEEWLRLCGSFLYLGSLTDDKGSSGPQIRRRINKATETFSRLWRVWDLKAIVIEIEDEKSKWGSRLMEDWHELGIN